MTYNPEDLGFHAVLALIGIALNILVFTPLAIYFTYLFYKNRHSLVISKRNVTVVLILAAFYIAYFLIEKNISLLIRGHLLPHSPSLILLLVHCYIFPIIGYGAYYCTLFRFWLLFYKTKFAFAQLDDKWKSIIDPKLHDENWWIANKQKYGSTRYLRKYFIYVWVLIVICEGMNGILLYFCFSSFQYIEKHLQIH